MESNRKDDISAGFQASESASYLFSIALQQDRNTNIRTLHTARESYHRDTRLFLLYVYAGSFSPHSYMRQENRVRHSTPREQQLPAVIPLNQHFTKGI